MMTVLPGLANTPAQPTITDLVARECEAGVRHTLIGLAPLMRAAFAGADLKPVAAALIDQATRFADDAAALMDLATVLLLTGHRTLALSTQLEALQMQQLFSLPPTGTPVLRVLALMTPGDLMANTPLEFLLEDTAIALDMVYVGAGIPALTSLPDHDVMFVAVGHSDDSDGLLEELDGVVRDWPRPVINAPARIRQLARERAWILLQDIPGLAMPGCSRVTRSVVEDIAAGSLSLAHACPETGYPVIIRPLGSHAGHGLVKIDAASDLQAYLAHTPGAEFHLSAFVDYRSADGQFRKYRIMLIDGQPYISHMGISSHWMIHYLNAGMADNADKRAEEACFMAGFTAGFAHRHAGALAAVAVRTGLSYVGIDCGETRDGQLLVFEADSDMIVHAMDPDDLFPYKKQPMARLFDAFRFLLTTTATAAGQNRHPARDEHL